MKTHLTIAVRTLVEHVFAAGDLRFEFSGTRRAVEGIRAHQRIQRSRPSTYTPEVAVSYRYETEDFILDIRGRIDGVDRAENGTVVEEIKTTTSNPEDWDEQGRTIHWAQAMAYAHMVAESEHLAAVTVRLTYVDVDREKEFEFTRNLDAAELADFFSDLTRRYLAWASTLAEWIAVRNDSIEKTGFPFGQYRPGQRDMAVGVYHAVKNGLQFMVEAATGIGKTMAAVFPVVKALGEGHAAKVFYLTARTTGRVAAEQALALLREGGLRFKAVTLTAKDKICFSPGSACHPDECEVARGHFDRLAEARREAFEMDALTREAMVAVARKHRVCPFEFSLELCQWADAVICDYNYAFDPRVYLRRFFSEDLQSYAFLVDEAHNLVDRAREMFSASVEKQPVLDLRRSVKEALPAVYRALGRVNRWMVNARKTCELSGGGFSDSEAPEELVPLFREFLRISERWLSKNEPAEFRGDLMDLYFAVSTFIRVAEGYDATYATCYSVSGKNLQVRLFCLDPSVQMAHALTRCASAVFFSATLSPAGYFQRLFGCSDDVRMLRIPSPFPRQNLAVVVTAHLSTLYRHRDETATDVGDALADFTSHRKGNYLLYFPSYAYLEKIRNVLADRSPNLTLTVQSPDMTEPEREAFIDGFSAEDPEPTVGMAVMGGVFSEGIDLAGDRLTGAAVVGVGLPGICPERELIREYFQRTLSKGFEFAYMFPGLNRVLQAAGRVIRTETDVGVVLLVDRRFGQNRYRALFPAHWDPVVVHSNSRLRQALEAFWRGVAGSTGSGGGAAQ